ncbi:MAG: PhzF family phenazine biosynthesis protein [Ignavibacteria bacterium]|nr:PhzF family phenazine biosynthesis protein [Ignavibacteria bacterium]
MKAYKLYQVDAFTETRFGGNPCAVVMEADSLTSEEMQKIKGNKN